MEKQEELMNSLNELTSTSEEKYLDMLSGKYEKQPKLREIDKITPYVSNCKKYMARATSEINEYNLAIDCARQNVKNNQLIQQERQEKRAQNKIDARKSILLFFLLGIPVLAVLGICILTHILPQEIFKRLSYEYVVPIIGVVLFIAIFISIRRIKKAGQKAVPIFIIILILASVGTFITGLTSTKPRRYEITTAEEFAAIGNFPKLDGYEIILMNDIDLGNRTLDFGEDFKGIFDGQGHTVSNFNVQDGLFRENHGVVMNVNFEVNIIIYEDDYETGVKKNPNFIWAMRDRGSISNLTGSYQDSSFYKATTNAGCGCSCFGGDCNADCGSFMSIGFGLLLLAGGIASVFIKK